MNTNERIDDLIFLAKNLAELLTQENESLERNQIDFIKNNVERKTTLARAYEIRVKGMVLAQAQAQADKEADQEKMALTPPSAEAAVEGSESELEAQTKEDQVKEDLADPAAVEHLRDLGHRIEELVEVNARLLKINIDTGKRFMESLAEAVQIDPKDAATYGRKGSQGNDYAQRTQRGSSVTLDQQL